MVFRSDLATKRLTNMYLKGNESQRRMEGEEIGEKGEEKVGRKKGKQENRQDGRGSVVPMKDRKKQQNVEMH